MKIFAALFLLGIALATAPILNAPADKYFGRLKMSAPRIRYEIAQLKSRYDNHKILPENASHLAGLTGEAYYDWASAGARSSALKALTFVGAHFRNTKYSKQAASELRGGIAVKVDPLWAIEMRATPTPLPSIVPSPAAPSPSPMR